MWSKLRHHLWWIFASLALLGGLVAQQYPTTPTTVASAKPPPPQATHYTPLVNVPHYSPLTASIRYYPLQIPTLPATPIPLQFPTPTVTPTPLPPTLTPTPTPHFITHLVRPGEVLASIALEHGVTIESILLANNLHNATNIQVGQKLFIPERPQSYQLYQVKKGDTILSIAARYGSSIDAITKANPQFTLQTVRPGDIVKIPHVFSLSATPETASAGVKQLYEVQPGDALLIIADQFNVSAEALVALNNLTNPQQLRVGTKLVIPTTDGLTLGVPIMLHEVKNNETLLSIVSKYGSSVRDVLYTNPDLVPASLRKGQLVAIPIIFPTHQPQANSATKPTTRPGPPPPNDLKLAQQVIAAINAQRQTYHLPALLEDNTLNNIAIDHAQDMVMRNFFGHVNPDGKTLRQRLIKGGFGNPEQAGENIQRNNQDLSHTVAAAMDWLMSSKPHRQNILNTNYRHVGVGIVQADSMYTIVIDFAE